MDDFTSESRYCGSESVDVPCTFLHGIAGTGKTYMMRERIARDPAYGVLCATTGIAAVNLGAITVNSLLHYFDSASLKDAYLQGSLTTTLHHLAREYGRLVIDEVSMMDASQLDYIYRAMREANGFRDVERPMGITLVGDFAQLPPIKARWAFEAECWPRFAEGAERLDKVWRQSDTGFLDALNAARRGDGSEASERLAALGVIFESSLDTEFDGTTIVPKNDQVDRYNQIALDRLRGRSLSVASRRWGKQRSEWKGIPDRLALKVGAYVMILANQAGEDGGFEYVNGDCGHVRGYDERTQAFSVELVRTGTMVEVGRLTRSVDSKERPDGWYGDEESRVEGWLARAHRNKKRRYVSGQVEYFPLRLAYASTVHKSQGLTLDKCQLDYRHAFFGAPAMLYVALSRCRTAAGLRLVGMREVLAKRCAIDERVRRWL